MPADDRSSSSPAARPPHPATVPRGSAVQPKMAKEVPGPHPATVPRSGAAQPRMANEARSPHPATVPRGSAAQPKMAKEAPEPHPATVPRAAAAAGTLQLMKKRSAKSNKGGKDFEKESEKGKDKKKEDGPVVIDEDEITRILVQYDEGKVAISADNQRKMRQELSLSITLPNKSHPPHGGNFDKAIKAVNSVKDWANVMPETVMVKLIPILNAHFGAHTF